MGFRSKSKKKYLIGFFLMLIPIGFLNKTLPKTDKQLEKIAQKRFYDLRHGFYPSDKWDKFKMTSSRPNEINNGLVFTWVYVLENSDTAKIYIELLRKIKFWQGISWREKRSFNDKYSYIFETGQSLASIIPTRYCGDSNYYNNLFLSAKQISVMDSCTFLLSPSVLYDHIENGHFVLLARYESYTSIAFYEPIAKLNMINEDRLTETAKIIFGEFSDVIIKPYKATKNEMANYSNRKIKDCYTAKTD